MIVNIETMFCTHYKGMAIKKNRMQVLDWPAGTPDLSPLENVWRILKCKTGQ